MTRFSVTSANAVTRLDARADRARDTGAQRRLAAAYDEHAGGLARLAFVLTGDSAAAEDLVHEAFARAFARYAHLRRADALAAYLRRTVVNLAAKHFRRRGVERAFVTRAADHRVGAVLPDVELRDALWSALQRLPYRQRAAIVLRFYEDLSERDTARILNCRPGTAKSLVHRGLKAMRKEIGGER